MRNMTFKPTTLQLETIATMGNARASVAQIAAALNIKPEEFSAWAGRLVAARAIDIEALYRKPMPAPALVGATVTNPRIVAERLFEAAGEGDDTMAELAAEARLDGR